MEASQSWGDIIEKEMRDEEVRAEEFTYPIQGANRRNHHQKHSRQHPTQPEGQTFHRRSKETYGQQRWRNPDAPDRAQPQRRPPQWQVVADLRNELEGVKFLLKQEKELSEAALARYSVSKTKIQEMEERWRVEQEERLQCDQEIRMLKEELKHLNPSYVTQDMSGYSLKTQEELMGVISALNKKLQNTASHDQKMQENLRAENETLLEKIKVMQKDSLSKDIKTTKQTFALKNKLEEVTQNRQHLASKLNEKEEINRGLQKELRDSKKKRQHHKMMKDNLQREMEEVRDQHFESTKKNLILVESLTEEKESLEQEVKVLKEKMCSSNLCYAEQLETLQRQLQEKTSSSIELISKLEKQEEIDHALQKEVEGLQKNKEPQTLKTECPQKELKGDSKSCVSRLTTRLRKVWTSESRHQHKRQRRQNLDSQ